MNNGASILDCLQAVAQPLGETPVLPGPALDKAKTDAPPKRIEGTLHLPKRGKEKPREPQKRSD